MNRTAVMTLGFLFVFFGIQMNVVDSYVLTPRMANFLSNKLPDAQAIQPNVFDANQQPGTFTQAGYTNSPPVQPGAVSQPFSSGANRVIRPPGWIGWPVMFLGAVFFLNGLSIRR